MTKYEEQIRGMAQQNRGSVGMQEARPQPEQEPVAWMSDVGSVASAHEKKMGYVLESAFTIPLYTTPPQRTWVNLPDEEIKILWIQYRAALPRYLCFARALLAKLKDKNK